MAFATIHCDEDGLQGNLELHEDGSTSCRSAWWYASGGVLTITNGVQVWTMEAPADYDVGNREHVERLVARAEEAAQQPSLKERLAQRKTATVEIELGPCAKLSRIIKERYGFDMCPGCEATCNKMNAWGREKCLANIDELVAEMKENATHIGWKAFVAEKAMEAMGVADDFYRDLIREACE